MHVIRTSIEMASFCPPPEIAYLIGPYAAALEEYGDDLSATILIVEARDTLAQAEQAYGGRLVADSHFTFPVELITDHGQWHDVVWIASDDGSGLVLLIEKGGDPELIAACRAAIADSPVWP